MLAQVFRPLRCAGSRLLATTHGTKSAFDNDQLQAFPTADSDFGDFLAPEPSSVVSFGSFDVDDSPANLPVIWPNHAIFNGPSTQNSDAPWVDKKMYQAPVAPYHQHVVAPAQDQPTSPQVANPLLLLQPVLMPVFCPFWGMQLPMLAQQAHASMFSAEAMEAMARQCSAPIPASEFVPEARAGAEPNSSRGDSERASDATGARRHRRSRRGGVALRKKMNAAAGSEEVEQATEIDQPFSKSLRSTGTPARWSDIDIDDNMLLPESAHSSATVQMSVAKDTVEPPETEAAGIHEGAAVEGSARVPDSPLSCMLSSTSEGSGSTESAVDPVMLELDEADEATRQLTLDWVLSSFWPLALTKRGCRIVQKAIEVGPPAFQLQLVENLHGRVHEAIRSPNTNYVLQKCIETMPPERMQFVVAELQGYALAVARHRFGCRIIQRVIEHCPPSCTETLIDEILIDTASLCRHQYGNFVIQHILQHGSTSQRSAIAKDVQADIIRLAKHRIASHVVSSAMVHCPAEDVHRLTHAVLHDAGQLADLSRREYGSFVVREVNRAARQQRA